MKEVAISLTSTVVGLVLGFYLSRWQSAGDRRRTFRGQVGVWLAQLRDTPDAALVAFHTETKILVRDECARIGGDVCCGGTGLAETAQQYYALSEDDIIKDELGKALTARQHMGGPIISPEAEFPGRARMTNLLQKICDYAK